MVRTAPALAVLVMVTMMAPTPAGAKMPPFEFEVPTNQPEPGEVITVRVTVLDPQTGGPMSGFPADRLDGLLGLYPADQVTADGRPVTSSYYIPVSLTPVSGGAFTGELAAPEEPGDYILVPFPEVTQPLTVADAYPESMVITVTRSRVGVVLLPLAGLAAVGLLSRRLRPQSPRSR